MRLSSGGSVVDAVVQIGPVEIRYHRAGAGRPVLLLLAQGLGSPGGTAVFEALAGHFRVIVPEPGAPAGMSRSAWIRDVIDGLGLTRPSVVAEGALGMAALGLALADPDRVDRVVVIQADHPDPTTEDGAADDTLRDTGHPLLVLRADPTPSGPALNGESLDRLIDFLRGASSTPR